MRIDSVETWKESVPLSRPYTIAGRAPTTFVDLFFVRIASGKFVGLGSASPAEDITGESPVACARALADKRPQLFGRDPRQLGRLCQKVSDMAGTPAARAALDMALHDLFARQLEIPLVDLLGRCHEDLPTSITIGIKNVQETLAEAEEYIGRGFRCLKVKLGHSLGEDLDRLRSLRAKFGKEIRIRVDANQGYTVAEALRLYEVVGPLAIEFIEQPVPVSAIDEVRTLPAAVRQVVALDESLHTELDAVHLLQEPIPASIWVIKLMKCGGITTAMALGRMAQASGRHLMWGCMDESAISLAAALHTAYACPATRYLDLDGNFDLARDPGSEGYSVVDGNLVLGDGPGLGVKLNRRTRTGG